MWRRIFVILALLVGLCWGFTWAIQRDGTNCDQEWVWFRFYRDGLRTPFFTGFLTLGTFILTLQATILLRIKEIYDHPSYLDRWKILQDQLAVKGLPGTGFYDPLRNLGLALLANVFFALITSLLQVTVGFIDAPWSIGICLGCATTTFILLLYLWWQIARNLCRWFSEIEARREKSETGS
jgi:hypothetical protein